MTKTETSLDRPGSEPARQNAIGALRLGLAGLVIYTHAHLLGGFGSEWLSNWSRQTTNAGTVAVQCFFVLSGWLVVTSWRRNPSLGRFLWHRFLRLAPALWVCLAITAFVFTPLLWATASGNREPFFALSPSAGGYVWHNLVLPRTQIAIGPFPAGVPWSGDWNGSLWTLFYEGACYLMVAALGLAGLLTRWRRAGTALIAALLCLHALMAVLHPSWLPAASGRLFDTPGKLLTLHFLAGAAWASWPQFTSTLLRRPWAALGCAALLFASWSLELHSWLSPFVLPPVLLWLACHGPLVDFERKVGGDYSYGLYIYGYPALQILAHFRVHQLGLAVYLASALAVALALACASWHLVEKTALGLKSRTWAPRAATAAT
jgi:peptidoglycan/LPS O-acetylase OafA/YrhL